MKKVLVPLQFPILRTSSDDEVPKEASFEMAAALVVYGLKNSVFIPHLSIAIFVHQVRFARATGVPVVVITNTCLTSFFCIFFDSLM